MTEAIQQLSSLAPQVAIAIIFGYVVIKSNQQNAEAMADKTKAFLEESKEHRELVYEVTTTTNTALQKLSSSIDANTSITKETKELMGKFIDKL